MDKNGYNPSILDTEVGYDYVLKTYVGITARHEIYFGTRNRSICKENGFWVYVCPEIHAEIHKAGELDERLKQECQEIFEQTHTRDEFMKLIGRNYL